MSSLASKIPKLIRMGNPSLRYKSTNFTKDEIVTSATQRLVTELRDAMIAEGGCGIAAPQIGINRNVCIIRDPEMPGMLEAPMRETVLFNPKLEFILKHETILTLESCLSLPGLAGKVVRYNNDEQGISRKIGANGFPAAIIQHETDHLQGVLYIDRVKTGQMYYMEEAYEYHTQDPDLNWTGSIKYYDSDL